MMNRIAFIMTALLMLTVNALAFAGEQEKTESVIVTGYGVDVDKARENAIKNAVQQVVGVYVASDTIVKNNQLIKDEILAHSAGYIKEMKIISQTKNDNSLFEVQVRALVVASAVKNKIVELHIATKEVAGESLFGEAVSKIQMQQSARELIEKSLSRYPQAAYSVELGKVEIQSTDPGSGNAIIALPLTLKWNTAFISELQNNLSQISKQHVDHTDLDTVENKYLAANALCFAKQTTLKGGSVDACYVLERNAYSSESANLLALPDRPVLSVSIFFKDKNGDVVEELKETLPRDDPQIRHMQEVYRTMGKEYIPQDDSNSYHLQGIPEKSLRTRGGKIIEATHLGDCPPNIAWRKYSYEGNGFGSTLLITDGIFRRKLTMKIDAKSLSRISSVDVQINPTISN